MKRYKVVFRYICDYCSHYDDVVFFFNSLHAAKRCIILSFEKLQFDVCFLMDNGDILFRIENFERRYL